MTTPALLTVEHLPIGDLQPDPFNPRRINDEELETLTRSIQQFGLVDPIIVRRADLTVIGGHQRLVAARRLGYDAVPVLLRRSFARAGPPPQRGAQQDRRHLGPGAAGAAAQRPQRHAGSGSVPVGFQ